VTLKKTVTPTPTPKKRHTITSVCFKSGWTFCFQERFARSPCTGGSSRHIRCRTWVSEAPGKYCHRLAVVRYFHKECSCNPPQRKTWPKYVFLVSKKRSKLQTARAEVINNRYNVVLYVHTYLLLYKRILLYNTSYQLKLYYL